MPVGWYGYADQYKEFKAFAWTVTDPGKEIFRKADGVLGISWGYWSALKGSAPLVLTLGSTNGFKYGNNFHAALLFPFCLLFSPITVFLSLFILL